MLMYFVPLVWLLLVDIVARMMDRCLFCIALYILSRALLYFYIYALWYLLLALLMIAQYCGRVIWMKIICQSKVEIAFGYMKYYTARAGSFFFLRDIFNVCYFQSVFSTKVFKVILHFFRKPENFLMISLKFQCLVIVWYFYLSWNNNKLFE